MMFLRVCPLCLGDMTVEAIDGEVRNHCIMCGHRAVRKTGFLTKAGSHGRGPRLGTRLEWPHTTSYLHPGRPHLVA
jgi:hypothetical protein